MRSVLVLCIALASTFSLANYRAIDLGTLGGPASLAERLNERGDVVGGALTADFEARACVWQNGVPINLGTLGGVESHGFDINDRGHAVGYSRIANNQIRAFRWVGGVMENLGTMGGNRSYAFGINNSGEIAGASRYQVGNPTFHAFIWKNGTFRDLGTLGGPNSFAYNITDSGWVVGSSDTANGEVHAFLWRDGAMLDLGTLGGPIAEAWGVNARGQAVITDGVPYEGGTAARWTKGYAEILSPLVGGIGVGAVAINGKGVVGGLSVHADGFPIPAIWEDTQAIELPGIGIPIGFVNDVADNGSAVGVSLTRDGLDHATLWVKMD